MPCGHRPPASRLSSGQKLPQSTSRTAFRQGFLEIQKGKNKIYFLKKKNRIFNLLIKKCKLKMKRNTNKPKIIFTYLTRSICKQLLSDQAKKLVLVDYQSSSFLDDTLDLLFDWQVRGSADFQQGQRISRSVLIFTCCMYSSWYC